MKKFLILAMIAVLVMTTACGNASTVSEPEPSSSIPESSTSSSTPETVPESTPETVPESTPEKPHVCMAKLFL